MSGLWTSSWFRTTRGGVQVVFGARMKSKKLKAVNATFSFPMNSLEETPAEERSAGLTAARRRPTYHMAVNKPIPIAVVGVGLVGSEFLSQLFSLSKPSPFTLVGLARSN